MSLSKDELAKMLDVEQFPLSSKYDPEWVIENEMGPNALWLTEALCRIMDLKPGMRVLDMGCGMAMSSIFLAKEYGVQVWATDLWIKAADNWKRIRDAGVEDMVVPIHARAHALPYADDFFDAIVSLDSYHYYGTDVHYLEFHMLKLLKRGGQIGIVIPASPVELPFPLPEYLPAKDWYWMHSLDWWRRHWERYPEIEVERAVELTDGPKLWLQWCEFLDASGRARHKDWVEDELKQLRADKGRYLSFVVMVGRRKEVSE